MGVLKLDKLKLAHDLGLNPNKTQTKMLESHARFKIFRAARRTGKSRWSSFDVLPDILSPNTRGWIVGPTYDLAEKEFRYIMDDLIQLHKKLGFPRPVKMRCNPKAGELYIETFWGSVVQGKTADKPISLVGEELDWLILSESAQLKGEIWSSYLRPTLMIRGGRALFPTTPSLDAKWLFDLEQKATETEDPEWDLFHCPAWECPHIKPEEIESARRGMSEDEFREQIGGEWVFYIGRVFKAFKPEVHIIDPFDVPRSWPVYLGIDYGNRDATAVMFITMAPDGTLYVFDEYYESYMATRDHCTAVLGMEGRYSRRPNIRVSDHHALGKQLAMDWARNGISTISVNVDRKTRRDRFTALLEQRHRPAPYHVREAGQGADIYAQYPSIYFFRGRTKNLIREMQFLKWKEGSRQEGTLGDTIGDDHAVDASEYIVAYLSNLMRAGQRRDVNQHVARTHNPTTGY